MNASVIATTAAILVIVATSCSGGSTTRGSANNGASGDPNDDVTIEASDEADEAEFARTNASTVADATVQRPSEIGQTFRVSLPSIPPIAVPDLSVLSAGGELLESELENLTGPDVGLDVVSATCEAQGGALVYQNSDENSFFDVSTDGSGTYVDRAGNKNLTITVNPDGSGSYRDLGAGADVEIQVNPDGSGFYRDLTLSTNLEILTGADGSGVYRDLSANYDVTLEIGEDGSGRYQDLSFSNNLTIEAKPDGSGSFRDLSGGRDIAVELLTDGSWSYVDMTGNNDTRLLVNADGSGSYSTVRGSYTIEIAVDETGDGLYIHPGTGSEISFMTDVGILDPDLLTVAPSPAFAVADRFPSLESLGRLKPPCVTVVRVDADILFDFDSSELQTEIEPVLDQLADVLSSTAVLNSAAVSNDTAVSDNPVPVIEIHGHTDSKGTEEYNQRLATERAESFKEALVARGVTDEIRTVSFGETRPVAPNERPDGSDNPAGRELNRRIEIVIPE